MTAAASSGDVEGVSLDQLVRAGVEMYGKDRNEWDGIAQKHGFPPGRFEPIAEVWTKRMEGDRALVFEYNRLYQQAMAEAGVEAPDLSVEEYASIIRETGTGKSLDEALKPFGMNVQQFSMLSQRMGERMMANPSLAMRYAQLISAAHQHTHEGQQASESPPEEPPPLQILG